MRKNSGVGVNLLVVGSGGREHALVWKLRQSSLVKKVFVAPGNSGMALEPNVICSGVAASDFAGIIALCQKEQVEFVVVGPDQALADGLVDYLEKAGVPAFGPSAAAAKIESSKAFAKLLMKAHGIPTAKFEIFSELSQAQDFLESVEWGDGWVIKADGLALGKGVVVCLQREEALRAAKDFFQGSMGEAGKKIVVEERLVGREVSAFSLCDGTSAKHLAFACDYKRIFDQDQGPNTGGMGAYSPASWLNPEMAEQVEQEIVQPLLKGMAERGHPFKGVLFTGLMVTASGPKVLEFNARFGDPETQCLMPLIDEDLLPWLQACREGKLQTLGRPSLKNLSSVHVVLAAAGYPGEVQKGDKISVPEDLFPSQVDPSTKLFFAGVSGTPPTMITAGGRVLGLTALAKTQSAARSLAYEKISSIQFRGAQRRGDVGE